MPTLGITSYDVSPAEAAAVELEEPDWQRAIRGPHRPLAQIAALSGGE